MLKLCITPLIVKKDEKPPNTLIFIKIVLSLGKWHVKEGFMSKEIALEEEVKRFLKRSSLKSDGNFIFSEKKTDSYKSLLKKELMITDYYIHKIEKHLSTLKNDRERLLLVNKNLIIHLTYLNKLSNALSSIK